MSTFALSDRSHYKETMKNALTIDPARCVTVTVDMQREYLDEAVGSSVVEPAEAKRVLSSSKKMLNACRSLGIPVVHAYVVRRPEEIAAGFHSGGLAYTMLAQSTGASQAPHRPVRSTVDRVEGSPESHVPDLLLADTDIHMTTKKSLDSFADTELDFLLSRILGSKFLILSGINTDTCVYSTAFTAANKGYWPIVIADCVASMRGMDSHYMALELMSRSIAWVLTLDELLDRFGVGQD